MKLSTDALAIPLLGLYISTLNSLTSEFEQHIKGLDQSFWETNLMPINKYMAHSQSKILYYITIQNTLIAINMDKIYKENTE